MRVRLFFLFLLICGFIYAQEKRLALVIGNANYDKGTLKNPVNDALLMKETFEKLGFEVILKTNVETRTDFINVVEEYNKIRKDYTIGFVYYAGHGVQIGGDNYLLPTKELYETENHFKYKGVPISIFTDEWDNPYSNEVNVLILDACRNNPLEKQIFGSTRNAIDNGGLGLAEMKKEKQPTGSIVAFSTAAGQTASDGKTDEKNSFYCKSLAKNMLLVDVSIRNIFGKVSKEIYTETKQYPEVSDKMFDVDFYLTKSTYADEFILIDSLIDEKKYDLALEKVSIVLTKSPNNKKALLRRGRIEYNKSKDYNGFHFFKADTLYPNDPDVNLYIARFYWKSGEMKMAHNYIDKSIKLDPNNPDLFYWRAQIYEDEKETKVAENDYTQSIILDSTIIRFINRAQFYERIENYELALSDYSQAISYDKENPRWYDDRANCYIEKNDFNAALKDLDKAIDLAPNDPSYYNNRADFYKNYKNETELALKDYATALKLSKDTYESSRAFNNRALIYKVQEKFDLALEEYTKAIEIDTKEPLFYSNRAAIYQNQQNYELALSDYSQAISCDKENPRWYDDRANCYIEKNDFNAALKDLDKAIELAPDDPFYYNNRADFYKDYKNETELALKDYATALKLSKDTYESSRAFNNRALIYTDQEKFDLALEEYTKAIEIYPNYSLYYSNRAKIYQKQQNYEHALSDYSQAISYDKENPRWYEERANCYMAKEDFTAALKDLDKAIDLAPNNPVYYNNRAGFYSTNKNNYELALKDYATALELSKDPYQSARALNNRALIYTDQEKFELALEEYTKAIEIYPNGPLLFKNRATIYKEQQNYELALADYTQAISFDKENPRWYEERANCYMAKEDFNAALKDLDKAIDLAPNDPVYYNNRAGFYSTNKNNYELALKDYATALELSKDPYQSARALNNRALIYTDQEKFDLALDEYTKAIEIDTKEPLFYSNRAAIYQKQQNYELALADYTQAISNEKENPRWYEERANCYIEKGDFTAALKDLDKAIEIASDDPVYYNNRADFYKDYKNEAELAQKDYATALKLSKDPYQSSRALNNRALIYNVQEKLDLAVEEYSKAIEIFPNYSLFYSNRADIYAKQGKLTEALQDYTKAIELDPKNAEHYFYRAEFNTNNLNKPYDALVDYSLAISLDSLETSYWWHRGMLFSEKLNNQQLAIEDFDQILKIIPKDINALNWRTIFYDRNNDVENAKAGYQKIISFGDSIKKLEYSIEDYGWANINLAEIYQCEDKIDEALKLYNEGINYMPDHVEAYYWRAWFFALYLSKYDEAINDFSASIKLEPKNPHWLLNRSKIYHLKGDLKSAKSDMNNAIKISNESAIYIAERGNFYSITGEFDMATKDFSKSIKLDSLSRRTFHYLTENLIRQGKLDEALKNATTTITKFKNDTISYEQIGRINFSKNELFKSLNAYTRAASIMEFNEGDRTIYPHDIQVFLSDVDIKIAEIYEKLNQSDLQCEFLNKAKDIVIFETRPDRQKMIKEIQEKLKSCQN